MDVHHHHHHQGGYQKDHHHREWQNEHFDSSGQMKDWRKFSKGSGMHDNHNHKYNHAPSYLHQYKNFKPSSIFKRHLPRSSGTVSTTVTGHSSFDDSRDEGASVYVSKVTSSGNQRMMHGYIHDRAESSVSEDSSSSFSVSNSEITSNSNYISNYYHHAHSHDHYSKSSIPQGQRFQSLASEESTIFHDAMSTNPQYQTYFHNSPRRDYRDQQHYQHHQYQHKRYYSDGSMASSQYTYGSYVPQDPLDTITSSPKRYHHQPSAGHEYSHTPPKHSTQGTNNDTLLEDAKPFWSRLKSLFETSGYDQTCSEGGLFSSCIDAVHSPAATPDKIRSLYEVEEQGTARSSSIDKRVDYHHLEHDDGHGNDGTNYHNAVTTVKKNNAMSTTNGTQRKDYSLVNLGKTPDYRKSLNRNRQTQNQYQEHDERSDIQSQNRSESESATYLTAIEHEINPPNDSAITSPPRKEKSQRRLFETPGKRWASDYSPDSIQSQGSFISNAGSNFEYNMSETDSYAADVDTILSMDHTATTANNTSPDTTCNSHRHYVYDEETPRSELQDFEDNQSPLVMDAKLPKTPFSRQKPPLPLPSSGFHPQDDHSPVISPMNTVGTNGTLHRRIMSTITSHSLAKIFDTHDGKRYSSPEQKTASAIIPKTVQTVKKNRYGKENDACCDDISPLDDDEIRVGFRNRMQDVDVAVDDDSICSPIRGSSTTSFDFLQKQTSMNLFGKENVENEHDFALNNSSPLTLGRQEILRRCEEIPLPEEPEGTYLPYGNEFQREIQIDPTLPVFQGWVAYSKETKVKDQFLNYLRGNGKIKRKHLRYVIIHKNTLYVFSSKKQQKDNDDESSNNTNAEFKKLKLSKQMSVHVEEVSRHHGQCIILRDERLKGVRESDVVCTLLPVLMNPSSFCDENKSQLVESKQFEKISNTLFAAIPPSDDYIERPILKDIPLPPSKSPHPNGKKYCKTKTREWPITAVEYVPVEQNTAALYLQFALDAAKWYRTTKTNFK